MSELRHILHECPELAFHEEKTKQIIISYLSSLEGITIIDRGKWFYAKYIGESHEDSDTGRRIAFRADFDAVAGADGRPGHYCGHDGHSVTLCEFAKYVSMAKPKDTIYFIFQPAEEIGEGAKLCKQLIDEERIDMVFGYHNIPGYKAGEILLRKGTFALASTGLEIKIAGKPSHAAYPEAGLNPAYVISDIISFMKEEMNKEHKGLLLGTVIGIELGGEAYGVSASDGILRLTIRGEINDEFEDFLSSIKNKAFEAKDKEGFEVVITEIERFAATTNIDEAVDIVEYIAIAKGMDYRYLDSPMRWSEDFGYYLTKMESLGKMGAFFGVGAGERHPELHTDEYEFNDEIIPYVLEIYKGIIK